MNSLSPLRTNAVHLEDVYKSYGSLNVLENIDLSIEEGEFCTLMGPSGSGKSTLFRLILGEEAATSGSVMIDGHSVGMPNEEKGIVYQGYSLYPHLTVLENVMKGPLLKMSLIKRKVGLATQEIRAVSKTATEYLESVRLTGAADKYPHELSGGMRQRVAIVQALMMQPRIILMDEPFGALDESTRRDAQLFLLELQEKFNMTIIFVTHDADEAVFLGSRLLVLSQYYTDDRGERTTRGSRIAFDHKLDPIANKRSLRSYEEYIKVHEGLKVRAMKEGFDPQYLQHVSNFHLNHPSSFATITDEECSKAS